MKWEGNFDWRWSDPIPLEWEQWQMTYELRDVLLSAMSMMAEIVRDVKDENSIVILETLDVSDEYAEEIREALDYILDRRKHERSS
tara:strand:+ start:476 stop:733 length:258 start_codon:yes stop_codon:yes gene_type:complete